MPPLRFDARLLRAGEQRERRLVSERAQAVLDGEIDPFSESWLRWRLSKNGEAA